MIDASQAQNAPLVPKRIQSADPLVLDRALSAVEDALETQGEILSHDNGFLKLPLGGKDGVTGRLHIWADEIGSHVFGNIHGHRWDFSSNVLAGEIEHEVWQVTESSETGEAYSHYSYARQAAGNNYVMTQLGRKTLVQTGGHRFVSGDTYNVGKHELHRVRSAAPLTLTIIAQDRVSETASTDVYTNNQYDLQFKHPELPSTQVCDLLWRSYQALKHL